MPAFKGGFISILLIYKMTLQNVEEDIKSI